MKLQKIITVLEEMAPLAYAEDFDNVGLLIGDKNQEINGVLICHDALENVVEEAIAKNCNLIVCFHPILFSGLKKITGKNYVERSVIKAIKNDIAIYAVHTALDNHKNGVNKIFCDALGLQKIKVLIPKENFIRKLVTYTIPENEAKLRNALFNAGAGQIGNYENCSFNSEGTGTYSGNEDSNPKIGSKFEFIQTKEIKIEVTFEIDENSILTVSASDKGTGKKETITITNDKGRLTKEEIDQMIADSEKYAEEDKAIKEKIDAKNQFENYVYQMKNSVEDKDKLAEKLSDEDKSTIKDALTDAQDWLNANSDAEKDDFEDKLKEL